MGAGRWALVNVLPPHFAHGSWKMLYCTQRDGISLNTLYRKAAGHAPSILVVKDTGGYIMGAFATEPWHIHPRFYGTGETSVAAESSRNDFFQFSTAEAQPGLGRAALSPSSYRLSPEPHQLSPEPYRPHLRGGLIFEAQACLSLLGAQCFLKHCAPKRERHACAQEREGLGVGGAGHFALWLDNDLNEGSSNNCLTFGSPCLASQSDFHVAALELWHIL
eukprot:gene838-33569_t